MKRLFRAWSRRKRGSNMPSGLKIRIRLEEHNHEMNSVPGFFEYFSISVIFMLLIKLFTWIFCVIFCVTCAIFAFWSCSTTFTSILISAPPPRDWRRERSNILARCASSSSSLRTSSSLSFVSGVKFILLFVFFAGLKQTKLKVKRRYAYLVGTGKAASFDFAALSASRRLGSLIIIVGGGCGVGPDLTITGFFTVASAFSTDRSSWSSSFLKLLRLPFGEAISKF